MVPRLFSYFSFAASSVLLGTWGIGSFDVVLVESPPLFLTPSGWLISRLKGAKAVMMVSDIWPDIMVRMGRETSGMALRAMFRLERWAYEHFEVVALTNPGAVEQVRRRFPKVVTTVISNGVDTSLFRPDQGSEEIRKELGARPETFLVGYCGLHGMAQGLDAVVEAADSLKGRQDIRFVMVGDGPVKEGLIKSVRAKALRNIDFLEPRPKSDMPAMLASCNAALVPLVTRLPGTMPSKIYEALAAGTPPIVAKGCEGEALVLRHETGLSFEPMNGQALAQAVTKLACDPDLSKRMSLRAVELARRFDRDAIAERTERILVAIAAGDCLPEVSW
jgi:glycosyltransferase involved in cell wall biosynthesis